MIVMVYIGSSRQLIGWARYDIRSETQKIWRHIALTNQLSRRPF